MIENGLGTLAVAGALCEAIKGRGHGSCPQEVWVCYREHQAYVSEILTKYWIFLGSCECIARHANGLDLVNSVVRDIEKKGEKVFGPT